MSLRPTHDDPRQHQREYNHHDMKRRCKKPGLEDRIYLNVPTARSYPSDREDKKYHLHHHDRNYKTSKSFNNPTFPSRPRELNDQKYTATRETSNSNSGSIWSQRESRTIFIERLPKEVTWKDIRRFFQDIGYLNHLIIMNNDDTINPLKPVSKAYAEFRDIESVRKAVRLSGHRLHGTKIIVEAAQIPFRNLNSDKPPISITPRWFVGVSIDYYSVHVNNIPYTMNEDELRSQVKEWGKPKEIVIFRDAKHNSLGFGKIKYVQN